MSELEIMDNCELNAFTLHLLKLGNIRRVDEFINTHFMKLSRICKLPVRAIWQIEKQLQKRYAPKIVKNMPKIIELENMFPLINTGIESLDELLCLAGDTSEFVMELCGSAGIGKSLLCQTICLNFCIANMNNSHVLYIDTKNDFNASSMVKKLQNHWYYDDLHEIGQIMKNIHIENVYSIQNIVELLQRINEIYMKQKQQQQSQHHNLHHEYKNNENIANVRLIIIDSLPALWFMHNERTFYNVNYWLTKLSQVVHQLNRSNGIAFILINLTLPQKQLYQQHQQENKNVFNNKDKPAMGRFWTRLPQIRLSMKLSQARDEKGEEGDVLQEHNNARIMKLEKCPYNETGLTCLVHINENGVFI